MDPVKIAQHSKELLLETVNAKKLSALLLKDFYQMVNVKNVNLTLELSLEVRHVHQIFVLKEKKYCQMEHVSHVQTTRELHQTTEVVHHKYVLPDKSYKQMDVVLNAIHTLELMLRERSACLITVTIDKNLDQMDHVLTAQILKELRELDLLVDQINAILDKESKEMVPVSIVNYSMLFAATEDAAQSQLANQWLNISQWMVSVELVSSINKQGLMEQPVLLIQQRNYQILKLWLLLQLPLNQPLHPLKAIQQVMMFGQMNNSCQKTVLQDFILTRRLVTGASYLVA